MDIFAEAFVCSLSLSRPLCCFSIDDRVGVRVVLGFLFCDSCNPRVFGLMLPCLVG